MVQQQLQQIVIVFEIQTMVLSCVYNGLGNRMSIYVFVCVEWIPDGYFTHSDGCAPNILMKRQRRIEKTTISVFPIQQFNDSQSYQTQTADDDDGDAGYECDDNDD